MWTCIKKTKLMLNLSLKSVEKIKIAKISVKLARFQHQNYQVLMKNKLKIQKTQILYYSLAMI